MPNPDTILYNGRIYTRPDGTGVTQALAITDGRVSIVGRDEALLRLKSTSVRVVDLQKQVVIPGLSDSHIHLLSYGTLLRTLNLAGARSVAEVQRAVSSAAREKSPGAWVIGRGWDQEKLAERRYLSRGDLDKASSTPVLLKRICGHVAVANTSALSHADIDRRTPDPIGGRIERDARGEPTGLLKESALELVEDAIPQDMAETETALIEAARRLTALGLTSLHCIISNRQELEALRQLKDEAKIPQTIYGILPLSAIDDPSLTKKTLDTGTEGFSVGAVKAYLDGSLGARTAALRQPYSDEDTTGILTKETQEVEEILERVTTLGLQLCLHAIGDRAMEQAVTVLEKAQPSENRNGPRHRIEHSSLTPRNLLQRIKSSGMVLSVQPRFVYSDNWAKERLGADRIRELYTFRSFLQHGISVAAGSDCPAEDPNPFEGVWAAVIRPGLPMEERLTVPEALSCYTTGSAYASFEEAEIGTLEPGKRADMVVLDTDPFSCPRETLRNIGVVETITEGKVA